ncbi:50S ribosomal protein L6 [candidate division WOR-1 bacterium RIFOXYC2_FULL_37_10]|uniref:Large ribosomal subunit protein uL6 n=1 Tax=candidate division WOR-1 bacterium RIFOXYB2_FULL_37_13 TaxID=1802579 RepID=A0A1F4SRY8_UNCSA|nr:MAG: 50S ribosomal protein L6 [candidate division WOR-1 bacterium RIFOXYA2_FULL_37_7]OGC23189.1 MAG: 50S ribosomal protein L6 [candidate division WOR-1 bacterium RIFOXYB2_FULL_37_13]OGC33552.1 MAG: 50S ribosomal protein L6 [candidate division WOR-1 bacterium RIFOXYC2_FULL_37_10]
MSRVGKSPLKMTKDIKVEIKNGKIIVSGTKGTLSMEIPETLEIKIEGDLLTVSREKDNKRIRALNGFLCAHIANMFKGVSEGFEKDLELNGVGYRAALQGNKLVLSLGYSHPVEVDPPNGISFKVEGQTKVKVLGIDKQLVGQVAADIRAVRKVEPYKGKGVKYAGEVVRRKAGKAAKTGAGA